MGGMSNFIFLYPYSVGQEERVLDVACVRSFVYRGPPQILIFDLASTHRVWVWGVGVGNKEGRVYVCLSLAGENQKERERERFLLLYRREKEPTRQMQWNVKFSGICFFNQPPTPPPSLLLRDSKNTHTIYIFEKFICETIQEMDGYFESVRVDQELRR